MLYFLLRCSVSELLRYEILIGGIAMDEDERIKESCGYCGGEGTVECDCTGGCGVDFADDDCYACGGSGIHTCPSCGGRGWKYEDEW